MVCSFGLWRDLLAKTPTIGQSGTPAKQKNRFHLVFSVNRQKAMFGTNLCDLVMPVLWQTEDCWKDILESSLREFPLHCPTLSSGTVRSICAAAAAARGKVAPGA